MSLVDHSTMKLGRLPPRPSPRAPRLRDMLTQPLPAPPPVLAGWKRVPSWIMGMNDSIGDCTCVAVANSILLRTTLAGTPVRMSDDLCVRLYERFGYRPDDPETDQGAIVEDVLASWASSPVDTGKGSNTLAAFAQIAPSDTTLIEQGAATFGGLDIGVALPIAAQRQDVWDVEGPLTGDAEPASWGRHSVKLVGYDPEGLTCITWGKPKRITRRWWNAYVEEAHPLLDRDWLAATGRDPDGLDWDALGAAMQTMREEAA